MRRSFIPIIVILAVMLPLACQAAADKYKQTTSLYKDDKGGSLKAPEGVACTDKALIVADTANGRLLRFTLGSDGVKGGTEIKVPQLSYPLRLQLAPGGDIYALDGRLHRIVHLTPDGAFAGYLDPQGIPAPGTMSIRSFRVDGSGTIYLLDLFGQRVLVLNQAGAFIRQVPLPGDHGFPSDLAVTPSGDLLLLDGTKGAVLIARNGAESFSPLTAKLQESVSFPTYLTSDDRGGLFLVDQDGGTIATLGPDGSPTGRIATLGWKEGQLYYPGQVAVCGSTIVVADRNNNRVQLFEALK